MRPPEDAAFRLRNGHRLPIRPLQARRCGRHLGTVFFDVIHHTVGSHSRWAFCAWLWHLSNIQWLLWWMTSSSPRNMADSLRIAAIETVANEESSISMEQATRLLIYANRWDYIWKQLKGTFFLRYTKTYATISFFLGMTSSRTPFIGKMPDGWKLAKSL